MERHLHIVCLDNPSAANYGGAIDMLHRIVALHEQGIKIHLHYFRYGEDKGVEEISNHCETVDAYERNTGHGGFSLKIPYIVSSRASHQLADKLNKDAYPVLLEGIHCTGILSFINKNNRKIIVRIHNDESVYYKRLSESEKNIFKKIFFWNESRLLKNYQLQLPSGCTYACITEKDLHHFRNNYKPDDLRQLSAFPAWQEIKSATGNGSFCLYHGNLSVPENEKAAIWLLDKVFMKIKFPFIIAGKNPSKRLEKIAQLCDHTCLVANPAEKEMNDLVQKAHVNVLPSFNSTGLKLKLLHALFEGRHCLVNDATVNGTGLDEACHIGNNATDFISIIQQLFKTPFLPEEISLRRKLLYPQYDNRKNAETLIQWIYSHYQ